VVLVIVVVVVYNHECSRVTVSPYLAVYCVSCFTTLSTSHSQIIMGISPLFLPSSDQVNIRSGHPLTPILNTRPHNSHMLLSRIALLPLSSTSFLPFNILDFLAVRFKKSVTTIKIIPIIINFP